jgi:hypothetical protein
MTAHSPGNLVCSAEQAYTTAAAGDAVVAAVVLGKVSAAEVAVVVAWQKWIPSRSHHTPAYVSLMSAAAAYHMNPALQVSLESWSDPR